MPIWFGVSHRRVTSFLERRFFLFIRSLKRGSLLFLFCGDRSADLESEKAMVRLSWFFEMISTAKTIATNSELSN